MHTPNTRLCRGFTLVELMVTMAIAALLLTIAVPTYMAQVRKSRRTEAKTALLDLAGREERLYGVTNTYSATASDLGYGTGTAFPTTGNGYYQLTVAATATTFTVTATAVSTDQLKDTTCRTFTINQLGTQTAADSSNAVTTTTCWR